MHKIFIIVLCALVQLSCYGQKPDSVTVKVDWGVKSQELQDFYRFEEIDYFSATAGGEKLQKKYYTIVAKEYWHSKLTRTDTLVNSRKMKMAINEKELAFRILSKKTESDSVKIQFLFPRFQVVRKFRTTKANTYSLRDPSNGKKVTYSNATPVTLFAYSLPYQDPEQPGWLLYCELSKDGIPPEKWGEKFGIAHYITIDLTIE